MSVEAHIVADSINSTGNRLTTFVAKYPRFIHSEVLTHRTLSRNSASSRAIPIEKMIQRVLDDPVIPHWSTNRKGMQEGDELDENASRQAKEHWLTLLYKSVEYAHQLASQGIAKWYVTQECHPFAN